MVWDYRWKLVLNKLLLSMIIFEGGDGFRRNLKGVAEMLDTPPSQK